jgi:hypothetical protein
VGWSSYLKALLASPLMGSLHLPAKWTSSPLEWHPESNRCLKIYIICICILLEKEGGAGPPFSYTAA